MNRGLRVIDPNIKKLLYKFGQTFKYYPGRLCSCVEENEGTYDPKHDCDHGFYYGEPETILLLKTQFNERFLNSPQGVIFNGGAQFTIPKYNLEKIEQRAWTTLAHGDILASAQKIRRDTDLLRRGVRDKIFAFDVQEVLTISKGSTIYTSEEDYTISLQTFPTGKLTLIEWKNGKGPALEEAYAVEFTCLHQYKVWDDAPMDRGTDTDNLPRKVKCVLRRFKDPEKNAFDAGINLNQETFS